MVLTEQFSSNRASFDFFLQGESKGFSQSIWHCRTLGGGGGIKQDGGA